MVELAVVAQLEADLLTAADLDPVGDEGHLAVLLAHHDLNGPGRLLRVARCAVSRLGTMAMTGRAGPAKAAPADIKNAIAASLNVAVFIYLSRGEFSLSPSQ